MAKLPVTQGATRRAYSRAVQQARRRWLATKLMGQQPRRAEPQEGKASREQLGTCFPVHGNYSGPGEGKCACLPDRVGWVGSVGTASFNPAPPVLLAQHLSTCHGQNLEVIFLSLVVILPQAPPSGWELQELVANCIAGYVGLDD